MGRIYCLLLLKPGDQCQVGVAVIPETSAALARWRALVRYPGARVLITLDITDVVERQAAIASQMTSVVVDGRKLLNLQLQRVDGAEVVA